jgi:signal transduction histidine kinase
VTTLDEHTIQHDPGAAEPLQMNGASDAIARALATCEHEREKLHRRLETVAEMLNGWVWETDEEHRFVFMTESVRRIAGRGPEWHYGHTRQELGNVDPDDPKQADALARLEARERFGPHDFAREQFGSRIHMRTIGLPQWAADGSFLGYCGIAYDVTSEVVERAEKDRIAARQRSADEQNARLFSTDRMKSELTTTMLGEARRPLGRARQIAALLVGRNTLGEGDDPASIARELERALDEIEHSLAGLEALASVGTL